MKRPSNGVELVSNYTYRRLRIIGVKISSRLDDLLGVLLKLCLTLVQDGLPALLLSLSTLDKPDNPSLLCVFANGEIRRDFWRKLLAGCGIKIIGEFSFKIKKNVNASKHNMPSKA